MCFHSLESKGIILHCWYTMGSHVPSATEINMMASDAQQSKLVLPKDMCNTQQQVTGFARAGLYFPLAPNHTAPSLTWFMDINPC